MKVSTLWKISLGFVASVALGLRAGSGVRAARRRAWRRWRVTAAVAAVSTAAVVAADFMVAAVVDFMGAARFMVEDRLAVRAGDRSEAHAAALLEGRAQPLRWIAGRFLWRRDERTVVWRAGIRRCSTIRWRAQSAIADGQWHSFGGGARSGAASGGSRGFHREVSAAVHAAELEFGESGWRMAFVWQQPGRGRERGRRIAIFRRVGG